MSGNNNADYSLLTIEEATCAHSFKINSCLLQQNILIEISLENGLFKLNLVCWQFC